jgi:pyruvate dehydrogenase E1 component alpha subunit
VIVVIQKATGLPLYYEIIPGNVVDISTIHNVLKKWGLMGCKVHYVIGDAGYNCPSVMERLVFEGIDFMTRMNPTYDLYREILKKHYDELMGSSAEHIIKYNDRLVKVLKIPSVIGKDKETGEEKILSVSRDRRCHMSVSKEQMRDIYTRMYRIRAFETAAKDLFAEGKIYGFAHLYLGEEAIAPAVCECLRDDDYITSTHRGHGHIIAKDGDLNLMMAELFGRYTGYCKGKGGSMHIADRNKGILGANGIVGAGQNIAVGAGLSIKVRKTDQVCVCFFGDGSTNQGTFHESLNMASIWKLPIIFVCENNHYGISMSQDRHQAIKDIADRGAAYNIPGVAVDGNDPIAVFEAAEEAVARARAGKGPTLIECKTYRQRGHFEGDPATYKPKEEQAAWMAKDPMPRFEKYLEENGVMTAEEIKGVKDAVDKQIAEAIAFADAQPFAPEESAVVDVYSDIVAEVRER